MHMSRQHTMVGVPKAGRNGEIVQEHKQRANGRAKRSPPFTDRTQHTHNCHSVSNLENGSQSDLPPRRRQDSNLRRQSPMDF